MIDNFLLFFLCKVFVRKCKATKHSFSLLDVIIVGDETTTASAKANAKYVVSEDNDLVKKAISCGYPNKNFGLSEKDAKSITYAAIQYLCDGKEYTGTYVSEFNELVSAAQNYSGDYLLDGVTIIVR